VVHFGGKSGFGVVAIAALLTTATGLSACGVGDKQAFADRIHDSRVRVAEASPAAGVATFELELDERALDQLEAEQRQQVEAALTGAAAAGNPTLAVQVGFDGSDRRARLSFEDPATERATVFLDNEVFVRRQNARATERRTWARLDLTGLEHERPLDTRDMPPGQILNAIASTLNPVFLVELVEGALTGSVERVGPDTVADVPVTRYDANISFDKAMTELDFDDEQREVRLRLFRLLGSRKDVVPAQIWVDEDGRLRRLRVEFEQRISRQRANTVIATVELHAFGGEVVLDPPAEESTVTYERFGRLVRSALPGEGEA
jgi:hypothetical protein